jgi:hypothetical protein
MPSPGLTKTVVPLPIKGGLQQRIDDKSLPIENFAVLRNCYLQKLGLLKKLPGQTALSTNIAGGGTLTTATGGTTFKDELLMFSESQAFSYNSAALNWVNKGDVATMLTSSVPVVRNTQQQTVPDCSVNSGTLVYAWEDTAGGCIARAVDYATGNIVAQDFSLRTGSVRPKVVSQGTVSLVFYASANTLYVRRYDRNGAPTTFGAEVALVADLNATNYLYDVCPFVNAVGLVYRTGGNEIKTAYVTLTPAIGTPVFGFPNPTTLAEDAETALTCWPNADQKLMVGFCNAANGTRMIAMKATDLTPDFAAVTVHSNADVVRNITGVISSGTTSTYFLEIVGTAVHFNRVVKNTLTTSGTAGTEASVMRTVGLSSKAWIYDTEAYVQVAFESTLQSTYFVVREDGSIISRVASGLGGGLTARSVLPEVSVPATNIFCVPAAVKSAFISENGTTYSRTGIVRLLHDLTGNISPVTISTDTGVYLLAGLMQVYDGVSFFEQGYSLYPENMTSVVAAGGALSAGTYQYSFVWEWFDDRGQIHRSAPSVPQQVTTVLNDKTTWTVPTLALTARRGSRTAPVLAVYRTKEIGANGGSLFYRVSSRVTAGSTNGIVFNDPTTNTVTFIDLLADTAIASNELLYTLGNVLENLPPEPCSSGTQYKGRLVVNSNDGSGVSYYTKFNPAGEAPSFNPVLNISVDAEGGDVDDFAVLDDKLILQKDTAQWVTYGEPAGNTGTNGTLAFPERIAVATGVSSIGTSLRTQFGVVYATTGGYKLLSRSLVEEDFGSGVFDYRTSSPSGSVNVSKIDQIRFYHRDSDCLVFDSFFKTWSTFTARTCVKALMWLGNPTTIGADGVVRTEDANAEFTNNGAYISMAVETGWISLAGLQGFARVWRLLFLCQYKSPHKLIVKIATDFEPAWKQLEYVDPTVGLNTTSYGTGTYGSGQYGGQETSSVSAPSLDSVYQTRIHIIPQKCESIKFSITDIQVPGTLDGGEGLQINGFSLEVGAKKGAFKPHASKTVG